MESKYLDETLHMHEMNMCILHMLKDIFSLDVAKIIYLHFRFKTLRETYRTQCSSFLHERNGSRDVTQNN